MRYSYLLFVGFVLILTGRSVAQDSYEVLKWDSHLTWHKHLIQQMHEQYRQRDIDMQQAFTSKAAAENYRNKIRKNYDSIKGNFPQKSPLNAKVTGTIKHEDYQIKKVLYESFPNHHVTANLYVPEGQGPFPAALLFCGHESQAKATASYQRTAILLAKHGFVVLVIDPISQGERFQLTDADGEPATRGGTTEHTLLNAGSNLVGTNVVNYEYWDNKQGLEYLMSRPEVDTGRIGVLGNSGGGTMTTYFMALNDTPEAAVVCSYVTKRERAIEVLGPQDGCQWIPYEGREHLEIADFLLMNAPVPTLTLAGKYDFVDYVGVERTMREMQNYYAALEHPEETKLFSWSDGHGISKPKREAAVEWFKRWFYEDSSAVEEGNLAVHTEEQLQVTETGQVNSQFEDEYTIQQRNINLANQLKSERQAFQQNHSRKGFLEKVTSLIGFKENPHNVTAEYVDTSRWKDYHMTKKILRRKGEVPIPVIIIQPSENRQADTLQLRISEGGKAKIIEQNETKINSVLASGQSVILADLRGTGELEDPEEFNASKYHDSQYRNDQVSLHIGEPVVGQRVQDIVTILDFIEAEPSLSPKSITLQAHGFTASPALHAAVLTSQVDQLMLSDTIQSYREILEQPIRQNGYAYVVPNALKFYDLPDLVDLINPKKVVYE
ncbi:alpha/beta hydrolase family protein [Fodinibius salsisoli]|uniref:Acetylxylan esterase n=1 Tax=Fodinibius salsisoli TaxID=2820877 RepID=A0ABT3PN64_9BACT|nr:acetylxylan esterase [Fodinibius salsisoli]MCW9706584.1 acetylxylan esterase [Fodinibius salsisoli]